MWIVEIPIWLIAFVVLGCLGMAGNMMEELPIALFALVIVLVAAAVIIIVINFGLEHNPTITIILIGISILALILAIILGVDYAKEKQKEEDWRMGYTYKNGYLIRNYSYTTDNGFVFQID